MATVVKKKKGFGAALSRGSSGRAISPLRPLPKTKMPPCIGACPQGNNVRGFLTAIAQGEGIGRTLDESYALAWNIVTETNPIPAVIGRVCPHPCETKCNRKDKDSPVAINNVERFIGDYGIEKNLAHKITGQKKTQRVAVVGAGPAGLSCAFHLAKRGYSVTMFEVFAETGGMLRYGIPAYRLPRKVLDAEIKKILEMGVELKTNCRIGKDISMEDLHQKFDSVFVAIGAHKGLRLGVKGEDAQGVYSGVDFLHRVAAGEKVDLGKQAVIVGGGDTAIDAARIALRLGTKATILYRRTKNEMPAINEEIEQAEHEGVDIQYLAAPIEILSEGGRVKGIKAIRMELGEPDASGRRRPVPMAGSEFEIPMDSVIPAISQEPDFLGLEQLQAGPRDWIKADAKRKVKDTLYAGGDVLRLGLVVDALGHGRQAADTIHYSLSGEQEPVIPVMAEVTSDKMRIDLYENKTRHETTLIANEARFAAIDVEVGATLAASDLMDETKRCMSCGYCFNCEKCWEYCQDSAIVKGKKGEIYTYKSEVCTGCKKCAEECPCGFIDMV
ncbi:MAG: FAD-dependent oxidoreductase [Deltaproteobacteria bacterium]|nr:FAD-dependent oxidoreductase [Deltaproteobacteria bacterium]